MDLLFGIGLGYIFLLKGGQISEGGGRKGKKVKKEIKIIDGFKCYVTKNNETIKDIAKILKMKPIDILHHNKRYKGITQNAKLQKGTILHIEEKSISKKSKSKSKKNKLKITTGEVKNIDGFKCYIAGKNQTVKGIAKILHMKPSDILQLNKRYEGMTLDATLKKGTTLVLEAKADQKKGKKMKKHRFPDIPHSLSWNDAEKDQREVLTLCEINFGVRPGHDRFAQVTKKKQ